jgi:hypothetical protein
MRNGGHSAPIAGAAPVVLEAGGVFTAPDGGPIFPVLPGRYSGEPLAFLAGDPLGHEQSLLNLGA